MDIDESTSRQEIATLSTTDHRSEQRRKELERLANVMTDSDIRVSVSFEQSRAFARPGPDTALHDFEIHIPVEQFQQVETDLPQAVWDRRVQVAILFHELGHVLYSDFERFEQRMTDVDPVYTELFRMIYNAAEDVVIEHQLANEFTLQRDFEILNETFRQIQHEDQQRYVSLFDDVEALSYTLFEAIGIGILAQGFGRDSRFEKLLDESVNTYQVHGGRHEMLEDIHDDLIDYVERMRTTADGTERVECAFELFTRIESLFSELPAVQRVRVQTESFRPVEAGEYVIRPPDPATELPANADAIAVGEPVAGSETDPDKTDSPQSGSEETVVGDLLGTTDGDESPLQQEAKRLLDIVQSDESTVSSAGVMEPTSDVDLTRWQIASEQSAKLRADLRSSLRRRRRSTVQTGQRSGRIDPHRLIQATQGQNRVFQHRRPGDERDYACLIVLDRSGSMGTERITAAENATAQLVCALFAVGVDVSVLSLWQSKPSIELPFGGEPRQYADRLLSERSTGGTPLSDAISIARERVSTGSGHRPFVVVITDGEPDAPDRYTGEIDRCTFDIYGLYIDGEPGTHAQYFDRIVYAQPGSIDTTLRGLVRRFVR